MSKNVLRDPSTIPTISSAAPADSAADPAPALVDPSSPIEELALPNDWFEGLDILI